MSHVTAPHVFWLSAKSRFALLAVRKGLSASQRWRPSTFTVPQLASSARARWPRASGSPRSSCFYVAEAPLGVAAADHSPFAATAAGGCSLNLALFSAWLRAQLRGSLKFLTGLSTRYFHAKLSKNLGRLQGSLLRGFRIQLPLLQVKPQSHLC